MIREAGCYSQEQAVETRCPVELLSRVVACCLRFGSAVFQNLLALPQFQWGQPARLKNAGGHESSATTQHSPLEYTSINNSNLISLLHRPLLLQANSYSYYHHSLWRSIPCTGSRPGHLTFAGRVNPQPLPEH